MQLSGQENVQSIKDIYKNHTIQEFPQLTEPTYWLSYEYENLSKEVRKLNEKLIHSF